MSLKTYNMSKKVKLGNKFVGDNESVYICAEGGLTNWGELKLAKKQVDVSIKARCDAVKFQAQTTEDLVSRKENPYWYKRLKYKELSYTDLKKLKNYCKKGNIEYFVTAHVDSDLDFLDKELNLPFLKVGSGESINYNFLKNVGSRKKPVIMSLGLHLTDDEILKSIKTLEDAGTKEIILLHCNTIYPTPPDINDLKRISHLKTLTDYPVGYSDHTVGWHMVIAAVALGATLIEKHISFDKTDKRSLDCPGSCLPEELKEMVIQVREVEATMKMNKKTIRKKTEVIKKARKWARQSITAKSNIKKGAKITKDMLIFKRPGTGLSPENIKKVLNKTASRDIKEDKFISLKDVS